MARKGRDKREGTSIDTKAQVTKRQNVILWIPKSPCTISKSLTFLDISNKEHLSLDICKITVKKIIILTSLTTTSRWRNFLWESEPDHFLEAQEMIPCYSVLTITSWRSSPTKTSQLKTPPTVGINPPKYSVSSKDLAWERWGASAQATVLEQASEWLNCAKQPINFYFLSR